MNDKDIIKLTKCFIKLLKNASNIYHNKAFIEMVEKHKFEDDDVTNLDIKTQEYIIARTKKLIPDISIIGEEGQEQNNSKYTIIIDPIDGTVNFKNRIAMHGTQICVLENNTPIISVLFLPEFNNVFYANKFGAYKNNKAITVSKNCELKKSIIAVGDFSKNNLSIWQNHNKILTENIKRIRMFGSSCFDSCMLAEGNVDAYIIYSNNPWDIMPGKYLMEIAGAETHYDKNNNYYVFGNEQIVRNILSIMK